MPEPTYEPVGLLINDWEFIPEDVYQRHLPFAVPPGVKVQRLYVEAGIDPLDGERHSSCPHPCGTPLPAAVSRDDTLRDEDEPESVHLGPGSAAPDTAGVTERGAG